jgi:hypothetical protein
LTKNKTTKWLKTLSDEQRIQKAKNLTDKLVDHVRALLPVQANAQHIVYSSSLADQIPLSHAANAFTTLQYSVHYFLLVRLCAIWDSGAMDRESILTVHALINTPRIKKKIVEDICLWHLNDRKEKPNSADDTMVFRAELSLEHEDAEQPSETIEGKKNNGSKMRSTRLKKQTPTMSIKSSKQIGTCSLPIIFDWMRDTYSFLKKLNMEMRNYYSVKQLKLWRCCIGYSTTRALIGMEPKGRPIEMQNSFGQTVLFQFKVSTEAITDRLAPQILRYQPVCRDAESYSTS